MALLATSFADAPCSWRELFIHTCHATQLVRLPVRSLRQPVSVVELDLTLVTPEEASEAIANVRRTPTGRLAVAADSPFVVPAPPEERYPCMLGVESLYPRSRCAQTPRPISCRLPCPNLGSSSSTPTAAR